MCLFYFKTHVMLLSVYTEKPKRPSGELALFMLQRSPQFTLNVQKGPGPLVVSLNCMHKGTPDVLDVLRNLLVCLLCFVLQRSRVLVVNLNYSICNEGFAGPSDQVELYAQMSQVGLVCTVCTDEPDGVLPLFVLKEIKSPRG